jgi:hypothetical protein
MGQLAKLSYHISLTNYRTSFEYHLSELGCLKLTATAAAALNEASFISRSPANQPEGNGYHGDPSL